MVSDSRVPSWRRSSWCVACSRPVAAWVAHQSSSQQRTAASHMRLQNFLVHSLQSHPPCGSSPFWRWALPAVCNPHCGTVSCQTPASPQAAKQAPAVPIGSAPSVGSFSPTSLLASKWCRRSARPLGLRSRSGPLASSIGLASSPFGLLALHSVKEE